MSADERYADGRLKRSQDNANKAYRARQARLRAWVDELAVALGTDKDELTKTPAADLVHRLLRDSQ